jgi:hypothetical protein
MTAIIKGAFIIVIPATIVVAGLWARYMVNAHGILTLLARWHLGKALDGQHRTNATWSRPATKALHVTGHAHRWHWQTERRRAAIRWGAEIVIALALLGWFKARAPTLVLLGLVAAAVVAGIVMQIIYKVGSWRHEREYVNPLEATLTHAIGVPPVTIEIERADDSDSVERVALEWAPEVEIGAPQQDRVLDAIATRLAIESPEAAWQITGRNRTAVFTRSDPPPSEVSYEELRADVESAGANELIMGLGKKRALVSASLTGDSPHLGISIASGGGKSNLTAWLLIQRLRRGSLALILDAKYFSHPWAFKDIDAEYGQLPNVAYAQRTWEMHDAMVWLGEEVERRTKVAERAVNSRGKILADVGPEIIVVCEELNLATDRLKQYWAEEREKENPKRSPAFAGMGAVAYAGRAVNMRLVVIGQMLTADVLGGGSVRENIGIRLLSRYQKNAWKMLAGDLPMPPAPSRPGHMQLVTGGTITEVQVPYVEEQVRELVMTSEMAVCPSDMPGRSRHPLLIPVSGAPALETGPDQPVVLGPAPVPRTFTLREAREEGILQLSEAAARKAAQRLGFPEPAVPGRPGVAARWKGSDLHRWQAVR